MLLLSICSMPWWLSWLLPALLGLALGWALWGKFKSRIADLEAEISRLKGTISGLEGDLKGCNAGKADLEGNLSIAKGRMREAESAYASLQAKAGDASLGAVGGIVSGLAASGSDDSAGGDPGSSSSGPAASFYSKLGNDKLQIIEGIGPKMEKVLNENGVNTVAELASKSPEDLKAILGRYGDSYRIIDPSTWSEQAQLAADGQYEDLIGFQKALDTGVANATGDTPSKLEKMLVRLGIVKTFKKDDLKAVEGIGPKIEELLQNAGIKTWAALAGTNVNALKEILKAAGSRFSLADPGTWPKQAQMADDGDWDGLTTYQDFLQGGK